MRLDSGWWILLDSGGDEWNEGISYGGWMGKTLIFGLFLGQDDLKLCDFAESSP